DGRIYISMREVTGTTRERTISVIEEPNEPGINAKYTQDLVAIKQQYRSLGFNYIRSLNVTPEKNGIQFRKNLCVDQPVNFSLLSAKADSVFWDFGDPASANRNFSRNMNPEHIYPGAGFYEVKAIIYDRCSIDTAVKEVVISADK